MTFFSYKEPSFYFFGLRAGFKNLTHNQLRLGLKKSLGKIFQPVNFYSRFPEYFHFYNQLERFTQNNGSHSLRILDVGSPKLFGFYLADRLPVDLVMTDISSLNIDEYVVIWEALRDKARGRVIFGLEDVRSLSYESESFDAVFCMSVIEHVEGEAADKTALEELLRVLKKDGLLIFSVPIGQKYLEQCRPATGLDHQGSVTDKNDFFQRIYSTGSVADSLMPVIQQQTTQVSTSIVIHKPTRLLRRYLKLGQTTRGWLGFLNPFLSAGYNEELSNDSRQPIPSDYSERHSAQDIYGDFIYCGIKK